MNITFVETRRRLRRPRRPWSQRPSEGFGSQLSRRRFAGCTGCSACRRRPRSRPRCIGGLNARPPHRNAYVVDVLEKHVASYLEEISVVTASLRGNPLVPERLRSHTQ